MVINLDFRKQFLRFRTFAVLLFSQIVDIKKESMFKDM